MNKLKALIITQKVNQSDDILGFFFNWLNKLAEKFDKINVLALEKGDGGLAKNIALFSLGKEDGNSRLKRFLKFNRILADLCLNKKIDIIFIHMCPEYTILTWPYARLKRIPIVMWYAHGCMNVKLRIAHLLVNKIITPSKESFRIKSNKTIVTGHGIDINKFNSVQDGTKLDKEKGKRDIKKTILSVGRMAPIKNYEALIKAVDILVNQKNIGHLKFQIVGDVILGSQKRYLDFLKNMVRKYKLENYVQFLGPVSYTQIQDYYQNCDLFVSTSNTGSLDKVVLEVMACGKIVLTSNEAFKYVLGNRSKNLMFEKGNSTELAEKIGSVLQMDKKFQKELGIDLRNIVIEEHNLNKLIDRLRGIFYAVIDGKKCK